MARSLLLLPLLALLALAVAPRVQADNIYASALTMQVRIAI